MNITNSTLNNETYPLNIYEINEKLTANQKYEFYFNQNFITLIFANLASISARVFYNSNNKTYFAGEFDQKNQTYGFHFGIQTFFLIVESKIDQNLTGHMIDDFNLSKVIVSTVPYQNRTINSGESFFHLPKNRTYINCYGNSYHSPYYILANKTILYQTNSSDMNGIEINYTSTNETFFISKSEIIPIKKIEYKLTYKSLNSTKNMTTISNSTNTSMNNNDKSKNISEKTMGLILIVGFTVFSGIAFIFMYIKQYFDLQNFHYVELDNENNEEQRDS
ncbi:hypothetical protein TVAG_007260 [Trichomonas vaginalis G3]|uniref:Uncharacterized protein n=1 Tax=Trichomonas vaginalis (strain ATCC PRA-98 / G3) TaxID=412133 RepID=A2F4I7_TRIV3|nr:hypothetical protein TVAGG3_0422140 [Trichomonas vaginalis G3]EAY00196.1 hypothetical protein TVAG_007260 [Trichomonas vaginalis G3]KAI5536148.1 hypothetical protein TVAGG3_0422140 [Trichomonas vaginalis G3]|eukprot:XP_001313125.1 hypothetical protein [Trichomonas vaginalis G3]